MNSSSSIPELLQKINISQIEYLGDRQLQEDFSSHVLLDDGRGLLAVLADGMGGHAAGEVASRLVVEKFIETFRSYPSNNISSRLSASLQQANACISAEIHNNKSLDGMGSTLVAVHISDFGLQWISVGDSLLYLVRQNKIKRLNADHSMQPIIDEALKLGKITESEAAQHPHRHALRSAVIGQELPLIDISESPFQLKKGDVIIIASDGILTLHENDLLAIAAESKSTSKIIVSQIINLVKSKKQPKQDNTTVQAICVGQGNLKKSIKAPLFISLCALLAGLSFFLFSNFFTERATQVVEIPKEVSSELPQDSSPKSVSNPKNSPQSPEVSSSSNKKDLNPSNNISDDISKKSDISKENLKKKNENSKQQNNLKKSPDRLNHAPSAEDPSDSLNTKQDTSLNKSATGPKSEEVK
jgi:protein phosphatase